jgi:hypothetical protein
LLELSSLLLADVTIRIKPSGQGNHPSRNSLLEEKIQTSLGGFLAAFIRIKDQKHLPRVTAQ